MKTSAIPKKNIGSSTGIVKEAETDSWLVDRTCWSTDIFKKQKLEKFEKHTTLWSATMWSWGLTCHDLSGMPKWIEPSPAKHHGIPESAIEQYKPQANQT